MQYWFCSKEKCTKNLTVSNEICRDIFFKTNKILDDQIAFKLMCFKLFIKFLLLLDLLTRPLLHRAGTPEHPTVASKNAIPAVSRIECTQFQTRIWLKQPWDKGTPGPPQVRWSRSSIQYIIITLRYKKMFIFDPNKIQIQIYSIVKNGNLGVCQRWRYNCKRGQFQETSKLAYSSIDFL